MSDTLEVATGGFVPRDDRCVSCGLPMLFRVDKSERVVGSFCGNVQCVAWLLEIPE